MTTGEDLDRLAELEAAATPGPWTYDGGEVSHHPEGNDFPVVAGPNTWSDGVGPSDEDGLFIAALRNAAPSLIADAREVERLRARIEALQKYRTNPAHEGYPLIPDPLGTWVAWLDVRAAVEPEVAE